VRIAYALPMTWACGGILVPLYHARELGRRGHVVTLLTPGGEAVDWFEHGAAVGSLGEEHACDTAVFAGDTLRFGDRFPGARRFALVQGKDHLTLPRARRRILLDLLAQPGLHVIAVSTWLAESVRDRAPGTPVTVLGNGIDLEHFSPEPGARRRARILVEGGFPDPTKNVIDAIEAASRIRGYFPAEVWGLGRRFAAADGLVDRVFEDPPQASIPDIYRQCDILLKSSLLEGFGLPHLEAMATGCIPVTYASGGVLDFCRHEVNSLVCGVGSVPLLVWNGLRVLADDALADRLRAGGLATAQARAWPRIVDALEALLLREA